ncbi:Protein of unknown function DUF3689 [Nannochloropsis gaditana]|uniref:Uncharacterized protein n=1 Tax=Nannochloropsis gaditana TaxID=72520 RepID=W7U6X1_9STRA|nr:Protein of unknown function DUF3689 [Nannochloropsis gaditana]
MDWRRLLSATEASVTGWTRNLWSRTRTPVPAPSDSEQEKSGGQDSDVGRDVVESKAYRPLEPVYQNLARGLTHRQTVGRRMLSGMGNDTRMLAKLPSRHPVHQMVVDLNRALDAYVEAKHAQTPHSASPYAPFNPVSAPSLPGNAEWQEVTQAVLHLRDRLIPLDVSLMDPPGRVRADSGHADDREMFVRVNGPEAVLRLLSPPVLVASEVENLNVNLLHASLGEVVNESMALLRAAVHVDQDTGARLASDEVVVVFFQLLRHRCFFDGAAAVLEDLLGDRAETFFMGRVRDLRGILLSLSLRQLAHFCRVLALLVFDQEDRSLMEAGHAMQSLEILQMRRDRLYRPNPTLDRNQALLARSPQILVRLVTLVRVMNHAPPLHVLSSRKRLRRACPTLEMFYLLGHRIEQSRWEHVQELEGAVRAGEALARSAKRATPASSEARPSSAASTGRLPLSDLVNLLGPLLFARAAPASASRELDLDLGQLLRFIHRRSVSSGPSLPAYESPTDPLGSSTDGGDGSLPPSPLLSPCTLAEAKSEMQFYGMQLAPHHVEVLFVLCALLGGRKKKFFQTVLLEEMGLLEALTVMFDRMSWGKASHHYHTLGAVHMEDEEEVYLGEGLSEDEEGVEGEEEGGAEDEEEELPPPEGHLHGPQCECTTDSALRVQFLRAVHNALDRDWEEEGERGEESSRRLALSEWEWAQVQALRQGRALEGSGGGKVGGRSGGGCSLISKTVQTLVSEKEDSPYRFWLCSCLEAFLRASPADGAQLFLACWGEEGRAPTLLPFLVEQILAEGGQCGGSAQMAFDLLGEVVKGSRRVLGRLEGDLAGMEDGFERLMEAVQARVVDSNVFMRAVLLTVEDGEGEGVDWGAGQVGLEGPAEEGGEGDGKGRKRQVECGFAAQEAASSCGEERESSGGSLTAMPRPPPASPSYPAISRFATYLSQHHVRLLKRLMGQVDFGAVTHENICVLNSALIVFLCCSRRGRLPLLVQRLHRVQAKDFERLARENPKESARVHARRFIWSARPFDDECRHDPEVSWADGRHAFPPTTTPDLETPCNYPPFHVDFMRNFRALLFFWQAYYLPRGRDRYSLEFSSHIPFVEWKNVVDALCADDPTCPTALVHAPFHLPPSPYSEAPSYPVHSRGGKARRPCRESIINCKRKHRNVNKFLFGVVHRPKGEGTRTTSAVQRKQKSKAYKRMQPGM